MPNQPGVEGGTAQNLRIVTIDPGQTVHTAFRWSMEGGGTDKKCQDLKFGAYQPSPSVSVLAPTLVPANCASRMPDEYQAGPFVPDWPTAKIEPEPLPRAPVLIAPKDKYNEGEIIEFRLQTDPAAVDRKCPARFEFVRDMSDPEHRESGAELREIRQGTVDSANGCKAYSPWSGEWRGPEGEYPIEVEPNGVRGLDIPGKRIVSVAELVGMGPDGEFRLAWSNAVTLTIVDPATIERNWGKTEAGVRADLMLDKLSYPLGENIPLHLAFENVSAEGAVYGRPSQQWRCYPDISPDIDYTVRIEKADGSKPQFFGSPDYLMSQSIGECGGAFPAKQLGLGKIAAVEDTLRNHTLLPREPGVYRITLSWTPYKDSPGSDGNLSGAGLAGSAVQRPFVTVTSVPLILTITPAENLP